MSRKRVAVDMPHDIYEEVKKVAEQHDRSVSSMITRLVGLSIGARKPETINTQVEMPATDEDRAAMLERVR